MSGKAAAMDATVEYDGGGRFRQRMDGSASDVANLIEKGQLRIAAPGEVPPLKVVDRIGVEKWQDIRRVEVGGRTVWVGRATFGTEDLVLDEQGKLVRAKKIADAAIAAAHAQESEGHARGPHHHGGALRRRYGRSFRSRGRVHVLGMSHDVTHCEHCGKTGLDSTVMLSVNGSPPVYVGSECADTLLRAG